MNKVGYYIDNSFMCVFTNCKAMLDFPVTDFARRVMQISLTDQLLQNQLRLADIH